MKLTRLASRAASAALLLAAIAFFSFAPSKASAQCVLNGGGDAATCTGDVSAGQQYSHTNGNNAPTPVDTLDANSLTTDVGGVGLGLNFKGKTGDHGPNDNDGGRAGQAGDDLQVTYTQPGASTSVSGSGAIITTGIGINATSIGGKGGSGHGNDGSHSAGDGHDGATGGDVLVSITGAILTSGTGAPGVNAGSQGGDGGDGGQATGCCSPGDGGKGGSAGAVTVNINGASTITTTGDQSNAISAVSRGGGSGDSGNCTPGSLCGHAQVGPAAAGGLVTVTTSAGTSLVTTADGSNGIYAVSIGGYAGSGGSSAGIVSYGASGGSGGNGGEVDVTNAGSITTSGAYSYGIYAQAIGGGGGGGGTSGGISSLGGHGGPGGSGGVVNIDNSGTITTTGDNSIGIFAQSVGGEGGDGGRSAGLSAVGGAGASTSPGGAVTITNSGIVSTQGVRSYALFAQSIGGSGGNGGTSFGFVSIGGSGGGGGAGAAVQISNGGTLITSGNDSSAVFAQSIGGGGGNGGGSYALGAVFSMAIGGSGALGGAGNTVDINPTVDVNTLNSATIITTGDRAHGIQAQSIGGGGGNGGLAFAGTVGGGGYSAAVSLGGGGGAGGAAAAVTVNEKGTVTTSGSQAYGIMAQSIGGGGGNGGGSVSVSDGGPGYSLGLTMGGSGGAGGNGGTVTVNTIGNITTGGSLANAIFAQSIGGGGGNGGFALSAASGGFTGSVALGGTGGVAGDASVVTVNTAGGAINTSGTGSVGIFAQSIGGGGGNGGFAGALGGGAAAIGLGLGGAAGTGGKAGIVQVTNSNTISTQGDNSAGILAQSVGGGGGNGGFALAGSGGAAALSIAVGGQGGAGSSGAATTVDNSGTIITSGSLAYGILAQSIGGGGGNGGIAISGALGVAVKDTPGLAAAISVGGLGGGGSNADTVTVNNSGSIETLGLGAYAISAQSIGGGGGNGGLAGSFSMTIGSGVAFGLAIGGGSSGGGDASAVNVTNTAARIITHNDGASGIFAQSIGGGGGDGGAAFSGAFGFGGDQAIDVAVAIGGAGGTGGKGKVVTVDNQSAITTLGASADGIFAQSVGGGGGNGGMAISGTLSITGGASAKTGVSVGGGGSSGGTADNVTVTNSGAISTAGTDSIGIFAQSVGGSGGNGGLALTTQFSGSTGSSGSLALAIGGGGGNGNTAGEVDVTNQAGGSIFTSGFGSTGIFAQSVGGGGGNGGMAVTSQLGVSPAATQLKAYTLSFGVAIGGAGGDGGTGNVVHVINNGAIEVTGDTAMGIFAQSIGGGGGIGGGAVSTYAAYTDQSNTSQRALNVNVAIGGKGGNGNDGGAVSVDNTASIVTHGMDGTGIFAQSVGGGGGIGGSANTFSMTLTNACTTVGVCSGPSFKTTMSMGLSVGGNGGGASNGGTVRVNNTGRVETFGDNSDGIFAESIGGGGGSGGNGTIGLGGVLPAPAIYALTLAGTAGGAVSILENYQVAVGGDQGSSGNGGTVTVDNNQNITTHGNTSNAIFAQSVGGGGGIAGNATIGATGTLGVGGKGGAGGDGGDVTVNQSGGATIQTFGTASYGIFAQSVGGGGGVGGSVAQLLTQNISSSLPALNIGVGLSVGQGGGSGGNGGHVNVSVDGTIITHGDGAFGVFAQSIGGGGGATGQLGSLVHWALGGNGDAGNAGQVDVALTGSILTSGNNAAGIFAQSAGGTGLAGNVNVTLGGSVVTGAILGAEDGTTSTPLRGVGSIGILAQSVAVNNANNGDITINLNNSNGSVQGGHTTQAGVGVGIWLLDGKNNTVTNRGLVTTFDGVDAGYAILATGSDTTHPGGNEAVFNYGTITGSVDLGAGTNSFYNGPNAVFNSGAIVNIGVGNTLTNDGVFAPGGSSKALTTTLTGNFVQSSTGTYATNIDFKTNTASRLNVSGTATLAGKIAIAPINLGYAKSGSSQYTIFSSTGGLTNNGVVLAPAPSAVATYALVYPNATDVAVTSNINYAPIGLPSSLSSLSDAISRIQAAGVPGFQQITAALLNAPNVASLTQVYNALGGGSAAAIQQSAMGTSDQFRSTMSDQAQLWSVGGTNAQSGLGFADESESVGALGYAADKPAYRAFAALKRVQPVAPDRWRPWFTGFGGKQTTDAGTANTPGQSQFIAGAAFGVDRQINQDFLFGIAVGSGWSTFSAADGASTGTTDGAQFGFYAMTRVAAAYFGTSLNYGHYDNRTTRIIAGAGPTEAASGHYNSDQLAGRLEVGRLFNSGRLGITPFASLEFSRLWQQSYAETSQVIASRAAGILGLTYAAQTTRSLPASLGVKLESKFPLSNGMAFSPFVHLAWVHEFEADRLVTPTFNIAPGYSFTTAGVPAVIDLARIKAGVSVQVASQASVFAAITGDFAPRISQSYQVSGGYRVNW